jgi:transcription elongation GreA/GreB family factor
MSVGICTGELSGMAQRPHTLDKHAIIQQIVAALEKELGGYERSARAAHAEATDEQSKAENKYDTRGLEASYLARGQSQQAAELVQAIEQYKALAPRSFAADEPIAVGAVVEADRAGERTTYFVGPRAGGTEVEIAGRSLLVITLQSPIGAQLKGKRRGDEFEIQAAGARCVCRVVAVE